MGQRLNLEIRIDNTEDSVLANCYYHWSAYTSSALEITKQVVNEIKKVGEEPFKEKPCVSAIRLLEFTGGGLTGEEMKFAKEEFPSEVFKPAVDRNRGLIAYTDSGIKETRDWAEGEVFINLKDKTVGFNVFSVWENEEDYKNEYEPDEYTLTELDYDTSAIPFDKFDDFCSKVLNGGDLFKLKDGTILMSIE